MPRKPREKSYNDLYHIVFIGTNKQTLFESRYDYARYLETMQKAKQQIGFELHAYCLMSNHVHMLVKISFSELPRISHLINSSYARFYNLKYSRTGHLFKIRYGSKAIQTESHYMNTVRYIHQNPVHAGVIKIQDAPNYSWSSLKEFKSYAEPHISGEPTYISDPSLVVPTFSYHNANQRTTNKAPLATFFAFHSIVSKEDAYEHDDFRLTDQEAYEQIKTELGHKMEYIKDLQKMDPKSRNALLAEIKKLNVSIKQISRLTGLGRNIIQRAKEPKGQKTKMSDE